MPDSHGRPVEHEKDFTEALAQNLEDYVEGIDDHFKGHHAMKTIPNIMARDKEMYSNPERIWLARTRYGDTNVVKRFKVDPDLIRDEGKLEFFAVQIQGARDDGVEETNDADTAEKMAADDREDSVVDDEGFEEGDGGENTDGGQEVDREEGVGGEENMDEPGLFVNP